MEKKYIKWIPGQPIDIYKKEAPAKVTQAQTALTKRLVIPKRPDDSAAKQKLTNFSLQWLQRENLKMSQHHLKVQHLIIEFNKRIRLIAATDLANVLKTWLNETND
ncbi:MAG: hypothetical protein NT007_11575 [Candidatus Kapabacteria bacterium]|nr:hypothetical protein [Candidatus Kapabacteria bacterium]